MIATVVILLLFVLLASGVPVAFAMLISGAMGMLGIGGDEA